MLFLARVEGFEPPITGPEPVALPLGYTLITKQSIAKYLCYGYSLHMAWLVGKLSPMRSSSLYLASRSDRLSEPDLM